MALEKPINNSVFVLGSREDTSYIKMLMPHLKIASLKHNIVTTTMDDLIAGQDAREFFEEKINSSFVVVAFLSVNIFFDDFWGTEAYDLLSKRSGKIIPVVCRPFGYNDIDWLKAKRILPTGGKPLSSFNDTERDYELVKITNEIIFYAKGESVATPTLGNLIDFDVFISHDHSDFDFAELTKLRLEKEGIKCWIDSEGLVIGEIWSENIEMAIKKSKNLLVVMSPEARQSEYVTYEWSYALGIGKKIIPIIYKPTILHARLETLQYLDFSNRNIRPWTELFDILKTKQ